MQSLRKGGEFRKLPSGCLFYGWSICCPDSSMIGVLRIRLRHFSDYFTRQNDRTKLDFPSNKRMFFLSIFSENSSSQNAGQKKLKNEIARVAGDTGMNFNYGLNRPNLTQK